MKRLSAKKAWEILRKCIHFDIANDDNGPGEQAAREAYVRLDEQFKIEPPKPRTKKQPIFLPSDLSFITERDETGRDLD